MWIHKQSLLLFVSMFTFRCMVKKNGNNDQFGPCFCTIFLFLVTTLLLKTILKERGNDVTFLQYPQTI